MSSSPSCHDMWSCWLPDNAVPKWWLHNSIALPVDQQHEVFLARVRDCVFVGASTTRERQASLLPLVARLPWVHWRTDQTEMLCNALSAVFMDTALCSALNCVTNPLCAPMHLSWLSVARLANSLDPFTANVFKKLLAQNTLDAYDFYAWSRATHDGNEVLLDLLVNALTPQELEKQCVSGVDQAMLNLMDDLWERHPNLFAKISPRIPLVAECLSMLILGNANVCAQNKLSDHDVERLNALTKHLSHTQQKALIQHARVCNDWRVDVVRATCNNALRNCLGQPDATTRAPRKL